MPGWCSHRAICLISTLLGGKMVLFMILPGPTGPTCAHSLPLRWEWRLPLGRRVLPQTIGIPSRPPNSMLIKHERSRLPFADRLDDG